MDYSIKVQGLDEEIIQVNNMLTAKTRVTKQRTQKLLELKEVVTILLHTQHLTEGISDWIKKQKSTLWCVSETYLKEISHECWIGITLVFKYIICYSLEVTLSKGTVHEHDELTHVYVTQFVLQDGQSKLKRS